MHDNIVPKPYLALELGKSISLTEAEEEAVAREVHDTHARIVSEFEPEPTQIRQSGIAFIDSFIVSKKRTSDSSKKLKADVVSEHFDRDDNAGDDNEETKPDHEEIYKLKMNQEKLLWKPKLNPWSLFISNKFFICSFTDTSVIDLSSPKPVSPPFTAPVQISSGPAPSLMNPRIINSGLVPQPPSPTPNVPPIKNDWDLLFFPMLDEYFNPSPSVVPIQEPVVSTGTPSSTRIDQDTPSTSTSQTTQKEQSHVIPTSVEEDDHGIEVAHMDNDL
ncbi:hypothetical protein Tco_1511219 [Tanacetum coccineum]